MNETNIDHPKESLSFEIKYGFLDYLSAINYKWTKYTQIINATDKSWAKFIMPIIKPFVLLSISLFAFITKLKHRYKFIITQDLFLRSHNDIKNEVKWSRFSSFEENEKFIFLKLDKDKGESDGEVLILKRVLENIEIDILIGFLKSNNILENDKDNEIEDLMNIN